MIAPLAKLPDWLAIQIVWGIRVKSLLKLGPNPRLEEALKFLKGPNFIPAESPPARVEFTDPLRFRFPTPRPGEFVENNIESDGVEFDHPAPAHSQGEHIVDRSRPRSVCGQEIHGGTLARVGATGHLAVAAWPRQQKPVAGPDGPRPALVGATAGRARRSDYSLLEPTLKNWQTVQP